MPSWKIHLIFNLIGLFVFSSFIFSYGILEDLFFLSTLLIFNIIGCFLPDIDTPKSKIRHYLSLFFALLGSFFIIINFSLTSLIAFLLCFLIIYIILKYFPTNHRKTTHTFLFCFIVSIILTMMIWLIFMVGLFEVIVSFIAIFWGCYSHILLDKIL